MNDCIAIRRTEDVVRAFHYKNVASLTADDVPQWIKELWQDKRIEGHDDGYLTLYNTYGHDCGCVSPGDFILQSYGTHYGQLFSLSEHSFNSLFAAIPTATT